MIDSRTTNSAGWEVQGHNMPAGWVAISEAYKTFHEARAEMMRLPGADEKRRVYESLKAAP